MQRFLNRLIACCSILAIVATVSAAQDFKQYPGSKLDEQAGHENPAAVYRNDCWGWQRRFQRYQGRQRYPDGAPPLIHEVCNRYVRQF